MKNTIFVWAAALLIFTSCSASGNSAASDEIKFGQLEVEQSRAVSRIEILSNKTTLRGGENGVIVMRGTAGTTYTISSSYTAGGMAMKATETATAAPDGIITWIWFVSKNTTPGVYPVEIRGGGDVYRTSYTVSQ